MKIGKAAAIGHRVPWALAGVAALVLMASDRLAAAAEQPAPPSPTVADQAPRGSAIYARQCASCHGATLDDGEFAPPLKGVAFLQKWGGRNGAALRDYIASTMPPSAPGSLSGQQATDVSALVLRANGVELPAAKDPGDNAGVETAVLSSVGGDARWALGRFPALPPAADPFARYTPVTEADVHAPRDGDWLTWRRSSDDQAFSPLAQISRDNVSGLRTAWAWALPGGVNEASPLVHDGIIFVRAAGDIVQALDGATGDLLWEYARRLPSGTTPNLAKSIAMLGDRLFLATSDMHVVALNARTGAVEWDVPIATSAAASAASTDPHPVAALAARHVMNGGPIIAKNKVIIGTGGQVGGGNFIIALNAATGAEQWRFATIEAGDASWNGLPLHKRTGGAIWTPGSYDAKTGLVFFGPAGTYDTQPLRSGTRADDSAALYTNNTLALDADTGKLAWRYNHMPNDQWDLDWAFERQIVDLREGNRSRRAVVTSGKLGIFDVLDARSGSYLFSFDAGLQDLVSAIDPRTGVKTIDPKRAPGDGETKTICPAASGGKNWFPSAFDPRSATIFAPLNEACMDLVPVAEGSRGLLSTGVTMATRPRPDSDGLYGRVEAIDLAARKSAWVHRRRAPVTTGLLATAGGLVFGGFYDRQFIAFDSGTGKMLWSVRLNDAASASPITYTAGGRQYVAVLAGDPGLISSVIGNFAPEIRRPTGRSTTLWVFELSSGPSD